MTTRRADDIMVEVYIKNAEVIRYGQAGQVELASIAEGELEQLRLEWIAAGGVMPG